MSRWHEDGNGLDHSDIFDPLCVERSAPMDDREAELTEALCHAATPGPLVVDDEAEGEGAVVASLPDGRALSIERFVALHERTGAALNERIDDRLHDDLAEFEASPAADSASPGQLGHRAQQFVSGQGYHADSRIFAIEPDGHQVVTNEPELLEEQASELGEGDESDVEDGPSTQRAPGGLLAAPPGLATVDAGFAAEGSELDVEHTVDAVRHRVGARVVSTPFFNPKRKTRTPPA